MKKYVMSMSRLKPSSFRGMAASWTILCHLDLSSADHSKSSLLKPGHLIFPAYCWSSSITVPLSVPCIIPFFKQPSFCNMCGCHATTSECYTDSHENQKQWNNPLPTTATCGPLHFSKVQQQRKTEQAREWWQVERFCEWSGRLQQTRKTTAANDLRKLQISCEVLAWDESRSRSGQDIECNYN